MRAFGLLLVLLFLSAGCDGAQPPEARSSVTVRLPPPRPADAKPGFTFENEGRRAIG